MSAAAVMRDGAALSLVEQMIRKESSAAAAFESRWTMRALKRVDKELCQAVEEQQQLFHEALLKGEDAEIQEHGEAMCRGWVAAVRRMEQEQEPDDAVMIGRDVKTGLVVAVGESKSCVARVREIHGERAIFLTPDEIASMFVGLQGVAKVKSLWPDAEVVGARNKVVDLYPDEPAQEDE